MLPNSRCTIIEITGKRVIDLGGLIRRGKPALLINTQEALLLLSFTQLSHEFWHRRQTLQSNKYLSLGVLSVSTCVSFYISLHHLSGQLASEVTSSSAVRLIAVLPVIPQTLVNTCVCMCQIRTSSLSQVSNPLCRSVTTLTTCRIWLTHNTILLSLNLHELFEEKTEPRMKPVPWPGCRVVNCQPLWQDSPSSNHPESVPLVIHVIV